MKRSILVAALVVAGPALAHAGQPLVCKEAALAAEPTREQLESCVRPAPLSTEIALGYALGGSISGFARVDKKLGPFWVSGRARYDAGGVAQVDALGGLVIWHRYGVAWDTWRSSMPSGGMVTVTSNKTVMRKALILTGGLKGVIVPAPDDPMSSDPSGFTPVAAGGFEYHSVGGFRDHAVRELFALYNLSSGKIGAIGSWHEAIPPLGPFTIGMELGAIPTEGSHPDFYLGLEVGYAMDL